MSVNSLTPRVREALGVSDSYDAVTIPALIRRCVKRLLRDYHFPKAVVRQEYTALALGDKEFDQPVGFKKELALLLYDPDGEGAWSDPLKKSDTFRLPQSSGAPYYYWLQGTQFVLDTAIGSEAVGYSLWFYYESMDLDTNEAWFMDDFEDAVFYFAVVRGAAEMRKPEVMQAFGPLWQDEQTSLAIYLNELEFGNLEILMRQAREVITERYPRS